MACPYWDVSSAMASLVVVEPAAGRRDVATGSDLLARKKIKTPDWVGLFVCARA